MGVGGGSEGWRLELEVRVGVGMGIGWRGGGRECGVGVKASEWRW